MFCILNNALSCLKIMYCTLELAIKFCSSLGIIVFQISKCANDIDSYSISFYLFYCCSVMGKLFMDGLQHWNIPVSTRRSTSPSNNPRSSTMKKRHSTGEPFEYTSGLDEPRQQPCEPVRMCSP